MYNSVEIRWFFNGSLPPHILPLNNPSIIDNYELRSDYYIAVRNCDYLGAKIRDGKLQIKWRKKKALFVIPETNIIGNTEHWTRWEWKDPEAYKDILSFIEFNDQSPFVKVDKKRLQKKFTINNNRIEEVSPKSLNFDYSMEITQLSVNNHFWWSIGFDSFKSDNSISNLHNLIKSRGLLEFKVKFTGENSYGYPHYISKIMDIV